MEYIINTSNMNEARKKIQEFKRGKKEIIVQAQDEEFNRKILENKDVNIFLSPEFHDRGDKPKQRDSGLNEFLCRLAKQNNIKIGIDVERIRKLNTREKAIILSRVIQNIKLCKRTRTPLILFPKHKYKKQDILSFFLSFKGSPQMAEESIIFKNSQSI